MDTSRLKKFAIEARENLIKGVVDRLKTLGFDEKGSVAESDRPVQMEGGSIFRGEIKSGNGFYKRWIALETAVKNHPHGPKVGLRQVAEEAAYTWFNRFVAIRILQKNRLIEPQLAYAEGGRIPLIVENARQGRLPTLDETERAELDALLDDDSKVLEQFTVLIVAYCHTTPILLNCFGHIDDYTELLLPTNILAAGGFIDLLNTTDYITDEDYKQTELIGWLYQFYISEKKDEVFASFKNKKKAEAEDIPAATQIFTPNWIVKYMVQNTLGRIYLDNNPGSDLAKDWKYLVDTPTAPDAIYRYAELESLKVADFASGSGHILNEFFDMLYSFYMDEGSSPAQAIESIFKNNLIGIDLDTRAKQLSMFSLLLKACQKNARFVDAKVLPRVYDMPSVCREGFRDTMGHFFAAYNLDDTGYSYQELYDAFALMENASNFGSTMKFKISSGCRNFIGICVAQYEDNPQHVEAFEPLVDAFRIILALTDKYSAIAMNPPYMGSGNMNAELSDYIKKNYPNSKADLFSVFMDVAIDRLASNAKYAMISMHSWMFLSSFENLRKDILEHYSIDSMMHLGPRTFDELSGEVVQNTAYVVANRAPQKNESGTYFRLVDGKDCSDKERMFLDGNDNHTKGVYYADVLQTNFEKIPGSPIGYWVSEKIIGCFARNRPLSAVCRPTQGLATADNGRFVRCWHEVSCQKIGFGCKDFLEAIDSNRKWFPYNKGGEQRKWYGNQNHVVNWLNDGAEIKSFKGAVVRNPSHYFHPSISWGLITGRMNTFRFFPKGFIYDVAGMSIFPQDGLEFDKYEMLGLLNTKFYTKLSKLINPSVNLQCGDVAKFPFLHVDGLSKISEECVSISKSDWDAHETSWDFAVNEIVDLDSEDKFMNTVSEINELTGEQQTFDTPDFGSIEERLQLVKSKWRARFEKLHENEEKLNRQFIEIYGLQDELTPDVPLDEVTILQQGEISIEEDG